MSFRAKVGNLLSHSGLGFFLVIASADISVDVSIAEDGKGAWLVGGLFCSMNGIVGRA